MIKGKFPFPSVSNRPARDFNMDQSFIDISDKKYRDLVETSNDLIWSVDEQGRFTFVNRKAALRIYGYEPTTFPSSSLTTIALALR
jgi:PAS domain-containing protein